MPIFLLSIYDITLPCTAGELQVRHALGYITCCPAGVSQVELEDILSLDDIYLTTVYQVPGRSFYHLISVEVGVPQAEFTRNCCIRTAMDLHV